MTLFNQEIHNRIKLSVYAYAYEYLNHSIVSDSQFDKLASEIQPSVSTGNETLDKFFKDHFIPDSGMWIHKHPNLDRVKEIYENFYKDKTNDI